MNRTSAVLAVVAAASLGGLFYYGYGGERPPAAAKRGIEAAREAAIRDVRTRYANTPNLVMQEMAEVEAINKHFDALRDAAE